MKVYEERICTECGKKFIPSRRTQITCCKKCSRKRNSRKGKVRYEENNAKLRLKEQMERECPPEEPYSLNKAIRLAKESGMSYAEYQQKRTLAMIPEIDRSI